MSDLFDTIAPVEPGIEPLADAIIRSLADQPLARMMQCFAKRTAA